MIKSIFAIRDLKANAFTETFDDINDMTAIRRMNALLKINPDAPMFKFPEDFQLFRICTYDMKDGSVTPDFHHVIDFSSIGAE